MPCGTPLVLDDAIDGEAREVARALCRYHPFRAPTRRACEGSFVCCCQVEKRRSRVRGGGRGGRNSEFYLALSDVPDVSALVCDTDGIEGVEDNAGAWFDAPLVTNVQSSGPSTGWFLPVQHAQLSMISGPSLLEEDLLPGGRGSAWPSAQPADSIRVGLR